MDILTKCIAKIVNEEMMMTKKTKDAPKKKSFWWDSLTKKEIAEKYKFTCGERDMALVVVEDQKTKIEMLTEDKKQLEGSREYINGERTRLSNEAWNANGKRKNIEASLDQVLKSLGRVLGESNGNN